MQRDKRGKQAANAGIDGIDFVRCRICGDHRRVISGRHLSKHGIDREAYMEKYCLSPDELLAKHSRQLQSSRRNYRPYSRREWIQAVKEICRQSGKVSTKYLQKNHHHIYNQAIWIFGGWDNALKAAGLNSKNVRMRRFWSPKMIITEIRKLRSRKLPLYASYALRNHPGTFSVGRRLFGSWTNALAASEIAVPKNTELGRLGTLRALRDAREELHAMTFRKS